MPPLFACSSCGVQIERATRSYLQQKGQMLCSTCLDRQEAAEAAAAGPGAEGPDGEGATAPPSGDGGG
ncbi:hypothetical protein [Synechococcus sp. CCY 9618]|uniref:hypothetical protein n=1 Tax=Synechococcus sp. CCY 9618 TaxID=2815602 RepID=UPI001C236C3B|nr:hypothetical protein [Synechococcus sp. CCY 9618]